MSSRQEPPAQPPVPFLDVLAAIPVLDQLDVAVAIFDLNGAVVHVNPCTMSILGFNQDHLRSSTTFDSAWGLVDEAGVLLPVEDYPANVTLRTGRAIQDAVIGLPGPDGALVWLSVTTSVLRDPASGEVRAVAATFTDVSQRKQAEQRAELSAQALAQQRSLMERIIAEAPLGIGFMDRDLIFRWANPTLAKFLGVTVERMLDVHVFDLFPEVREQFGGIMRGVLDNGEPFRAKASPFIYQVDGVERTTYWDFTYMPLFDAAGQVDGILVVNLEVSERVESEHLHQLQIEKMNEFDRVKSEFVSSVSHELRTPLTSIRGYLEFLEDGLGGELSDEQMSYVRQALMGAGRLRGLVDDLLDFAQIDAGTFKLRLAEADCVAKAREVLESFDPQARKNHVQLIGDLPNVPLSAKVDAARIGQVLVNLVGNALKFTPEGGTIRLVVRREPAAIRFEVHDTGIGIAPEDVPKLFQRFSQLDTSNTRTSGGTGLGLNITKAIVESHGGTLGVESTPGQGSTFWFELPTAPGGA